ncbi:response regulator [Brevibacillus fluminis]|uniref:Response regulator n=1 Tax=Brevibacillus fluminis TaxID=511487 RepID=A0A3M8DSW7_9BACL|nr:response regulator [Brevibacillus fluminis]RNB91258.1 response regulator [Brevibacillus fluminis]
MARILIADDSVVVREYIKQTLERAGHQVIAEATTGYEAYHQYLTHRPDLITMDINMPELNGIETVKLIVKENHAAKIIIVSTYGLKPLVFEAIKAGASDYITKPVDEDKLLGAMANVL